MRRLGAWIIIVPAISLFSFSIVASAAGFQSKPDVKSAAAKVVRQNDKTRRSDSSGDKAKHDGSLVVVGSSQDAGVSGVLGHGARQVCWISKSQLVRVSAVYRTSTSTLRVGDTTYDLVTVFAANDHTLRLPLGAPAVQCQLVQSEHLFFLPFDPNLS